MRGDVTACFCNNRNVRLLFFSPLTVESYELPAKNEPYGSSCESRRRVVALFAASQVLCKSTEPGESLAVVSYVRRNVCKVYTGLFISLSGISELDCATTKTDTAERSISIDRESLQVFFCTRGLGVLPGSTAWG